MTAALDLMAWLDRATVPGGSALRERYMLESATWIPYVRPDCNSEAMLAYLHLWQESGDAAHLAKSRAIWDAIKNLQQYTIGYWPFFEGSSKWYTNDCSEVAIFLLRCAEIDTEKATEYRTKALLTCTFLRSKQDATSGMFDTASVYGYEAPWSTAHAVSALAVAYPYAGANQATYLAAIEAGLAGVAGMTGEDGRVITGAEVHGTSEAWRPPSSDQAICIRAYALAELNCPGSTHAATWAANRQALHGWMDPLIHSSGAVRNGYGVGVTNADVYHITDHVYTTAFAIEAYRLSALVDDDPAHLATADAIANFTAGNIWYNPAIPDEHGCIRGAYDLDAQDFGTEEVAQNVEEEGGGNVAYTGWTAAPIAALFFARPPTPTQTRRRRGSVACFL